MCWFKKIKKKKVFLNIAVPKILSNSTMGENKKKSIILQKGIYHICFQKTGSHLQKISLTKSDIDSHLQLQFDTWCLGRQWDSIQIPDIPEQLQLLLKTRQSELLQVEPKKFFGAQSPFR